MDEYLRRLDIKCSKTLPTMAQQMTAAIPEVIEIVAQRVLNVCRLSMVSLFLFNAITVANPAQCIGR